MIEPKKQKKSWGWLILIVACLLIVSLVKDLGRVQSGFRRLAESEVRLGEAEKENLELKKKLKVVETAFFREKTVREKLNMQRSGETVVVMEGIKEGQPVVESEKVEVPNWQKWSFLWQ